MIIENGSLIDYLSKMPRNAKVSVKVEKEGATLVVEGNDMEFRFKLALRASIANIPVEYWS